MNTVERRKAAVVGNPIAHSLSPQLHFAGWNPSDFSRIELAPADFAEFLDSWDDTWAGCAVTMPFKFAALKCADLVDGLAAAVGAANTIVVQPTGANSHLTVAFNTDVAGIVHAIWEVTDAQRILGNHDSNTDSQLLAVTDSQTNARLGEDGELRGNADADFALTHRKFTKAVILGSGATASSALAALLQLGAAEITICARRSSGPNTVFSAAHRLHLDYHYQQLASPQCAEQILQSELLISTLPAGAADNLAQQLADLLASRVDSAQGDEDSADAEILAGKVLLDVVYAPYPSKLIQVWERFGGTVVPGWLMLLHQAIDQARLFTGKEPDVPAMRAALAQALQERN